MSAEAEFATALAAFQAVLPNVSKDQIAKVKTKQGGEYGYQYADLTRISAIALPLLAKHGLAFSARPTMLTDVGFVLAYSLLHTSGHRYVGAYPLPDPAHSTPQEIGSALTYARRYALCAVTGIAPGGEDDDGQAASQARSAPRQRPAKPAGDDSFLDALHPLKVAKARVWGAAQKRGLDEDALRVDFASQHDDKRIDDASVAELEAYAELLETGAVA